MCFVYFSPFLLFGQISSHLLLLLTSPPHCCTEAGQAHFTLCMTFLVNTTKLIWPIQTASSQGNFLIMPSCCSSFKYTRPPWSTFGGVIMHTLCTGVS